MYGKLGYVCGGGSGGGSGVGGDYLPRGVVVHMFDGSLLPMGMSFQEGWWYTYLMVAYS